MNHQKTLLSLALASALGVSAVADANTLTASWTGAFTMISPTGQFFVNTDLANCYPGMLNGTNCYRSSVSGTLSFDTSTGTGSGTVVPFSFCGTGDMSNFTLNFKAIGNGFGGPGTLMLGNMNFDWNANNGIPVSIVWDAAGFFGAVGGGLSVGQTITGGALPASNNTELDSNGVPGGTTYPIGPAVMATTIYNTTTIAGASLGSNPSGTLPFVTDTVVDITNGDLGVGGSPMPTPPFRAYNMNLDILSAQVTSVAVPQVPIPSAIWLFGSGLVGLVSLARRKRGRPSTQAG